jgi:hypothetical protein
LKKSILNFFTLFLVLFWYLYSFFEGFFFFGVFRISY